MKAKGKGGENVTTEQMVEKIFELERESAALKEQNKTVFSRLDKQDGIIEVLRTQTATLGTLADGQNRVERKLNGVISDVDELKSKPGKRWETAVDVIFKAAITAMVGVLLAKIGIG